jgi:hypothetical protein
MGLKNVFTAGACAVLLASSGVSLADEYRPGEFLGLDLSRAVLSPKPLGPPAEFAPVPVEAKADRAPAHVADVRQPKIRPAHVARENRHAAAHTRLARHHGNPLDAQAFDTRIQVWPCKSGGICNWKR